MKKLYYLAIMGMIAVTVPACKKDSKPVTSALNKAVGKWNGYIGINQFYLDGKLLGADTTKSTSNSYILNLSADGTGSVYLDNKIKATTFNYTIADSKINYTNEIYYNNDGTVNAHDPDYFEKIISLTDNRMVTSLEQSSSQNGHTSTEIDIIYFSKIN